MKSFHITIQQKLYNFNDLCYTFRSCSHPFYIEWSYYYFSVCVCVFFVLSIRALSHPSRFLTLWSMQQKSIELCISTPLTVVFAIDSSRKCNWSGSHILVNGNLCTFQSNKKHRKSVAKRRGPTTRNRSPDITKKKNKNMQIGQQIYHYEWIRAICCRIEFVCSTNTRIFCSTHQLKHGFILSARVRARIRCACTRSICFVCVLLSCQLSVARMSDHHSFLDLFVFFGQYTNINKLDKAITFTTQFIFRIFPSEIAHIL